MIESTKPSEFLHDRGPNRLLSDIAARPGNADAEVEACLTRLVGFIPDKYSRIYVDRECSIRKGGEIDRKWCVRSYADFSVNAEGSTLAEAEADYRRKFALESRKFEIEARVRRELAELDAADSATKGETKPTTTNTRDDGDATSGTLPLVKLGPGGDFTREVRP